MTRLTKRLHLSAASWADALDFVGPRVRTSLAGWALLALGLVAVLHGAERMDASQQAWDEAESTLKRLQRGGQRMAVTTQALAPSGRDPATAEPALAEGAWQHAGQLAQVLGFDWANVLRRVDTVADQEQVVLLQFSLDLAALGSGPDAQPEIKLQAAVRDDAHALQWLEAAGPYASLRSRERLSTPFDTRHGSYAWRVDVSIRGGGP
ncbi:MAG: hypothetical protein HY836_04615 [Aquabacterium sp.]|uniref:hypothetical protein n=1 Tax=Aquabacterium sp. TaxID=1872578 RepID=UPI0025C02055|nr:hypothetical protein [Aquabacterium sp.]MBI5924860.1 hypothetical protein [Aquabacterium sp.]